MRVLLATSVLLLANVPSTARAAAIVVTSTADGTPANDGHCTLREAIDNANSDDQSGSTDCVAGSGADSITFSVTGPIALTGELIILDKLTITGPNVTISGANASQIFFVNSGTKLTLSFDARQQSLGLLQTSAYTSKPAKPGHQPEGGTAPLR